MSRKIVFCLLSCLALLATCARDNSEQLAQKAEKPPLADTLVTIFEELKAAALSNRPEALAGFLDSSETSRLTYACHHYGFSALGQYLKLLFAGWPDPDTLSLEDLTVKPPYARLALAGRGTQFGFREERIRYTFLLFRYVSKDWRLAGVSSLEKARYDPYGTPLGYFETELPPKLRFPRLF